MSIVIELPSQAAQTAFNRTVWARLLADQASLKAAQASLAADEAGLVGVRASLDDAIADYERNQELLASGDISPSTLEVQVSEAPLSVPSSASVPRPVKSMELPSVKLGSGAVVQHREIDRRCRVGSERLR